MKEDTRGVGMENRQKDAKAVRFTVGEARGKRRACWAIMKNPEKRVEARTRRSSNRSGKPDKWWV